MAVRSARVLCRFPLWCLSGGLDSSILRFVLKILREIPFDSREFPVCRLRFLRHFRECWDLGLDFCGDFCFVGEVSGGARMSRVRLEVHAGGDRLGLFGVADGRGPVRDGFGRGRAAAFIVGHRGTRRASVRGARAARARLVRAAVVGAAVVGAYVVGPVLGAHTLFGATSVFFRAAVSEYVFGARKLGARVLGSGVLGGSCFCECAAQDGHGQVVPPTEADRLHRARRGPVERVVRARAGHRRLDARQRPAPTRTVELERVGEESLTYVGAL